MFSSFVSLVYYESSKLSLNITSLRPTTVMSPNEKNPESIADDLVTQFKRSGQFDELRRKLFRDFKENVSISSYTWLVVLY